MMKKPSSLGVVLAGPIAVALVAGSSCVDERTQFSKMQAADNNQAATRIAPNRCAEPTPSEEALDPVALEVAAIVSEMSTGALDSVCGEIGLNAAQDNIVPAVAYECGAILQPQSGAIVFENADVCQDVPNGITTADAREIGRRADTLRERCSDEATKFGFKICSVVTDSIDNTGEGRATISACAAVPDCP